MRHTWLKPPLRMRANPKTRSGCKGAVCNGFAACATPPYKLGVHLPIVGWEPWVVNETWAIICDSPTASLHEVVGWHKFGPLVTCFIGVLHRPSSEGPMTHYMLGVLHCPSSEGPMAHLCQVHWLACVRCTILHSCGLFGSSLWGDWLS